jgi:hypothetical protein
LVIELSAHLLLVIELSAHLLLVIELSAHLRITASDRPLGIVKLSNL